MDSQPKFCRVDTLAEQAIGLEDPCAVLLENGPGFSVLVARRIGYSFMSGRLKLELTFQLRIDEQQKEHFRGFAAVDIYQQEGGVWVAEDSERGRLFSSPSDEAYRLVYLPYPEYEALRESELKHRADDLFAYCRDSFGRLPGFFSPNLKTLVTPENYACARDRFGNQEFL
ncbi:MAG: hypothetical protein AAF591_07970 [Verrucomicrobiota bacterium]